MFEGVRAFLFDFDGTLVQPSIDFDQMRVEVLKVVASFGVNPLPLARMHVLELVGRARAELSQRDGDRAKAFLEATEGVIVGIEVRAADGVEAYAGAPEMLEKLNMLGYAVGIVTRNCRPAVERVMARIPMHHDILLTRDDVVHVKPDARHLLTALDVLGEPGDHAVMCGDHPMDVMAGQAINARTVGVLRPGVERAYFADVSPDIVLDHVTDLLAHVECCSTVRR